MADRILHLIASNFISGPEKQILHHARDMAGSPYEICVASFHDLPGEPEIITAARNGGTPAYLVRGGFNPLQITDLAKVLRQERIAVLCTHGYKANIVGRLASLLSRVPHAAFVRGWTAETPRVALYEKLERRMLASAPWVVCVSALQAEQLVAVRGSRRPPIVIQNAVLPGPATPQNDSTFSRHDAGIQEGVFVFASAGRLSIEKGHAYLLAAFADLLKRSPSRGCYLVLLGDGRELANLKLRALELGISEKVKFAGFQPDIRQWMRLADCLVQPSLTEGTPNSVLEALQLNLPIIATSVGGVPDLLRDGLSGMLVPPREPGKLADAMEAVVNSEELRATLSRGISAIDPKYKPETQRASLVRLYEDVLQSAGRQL